MPGDGSSSGTAKREPLAQRRKALGLTQEALAELLDVERSTVARWERGESEPLPWIRPKLARVLRVSADRIEDLLDNGRATGIDAHRAGPLPTVPRLLPAAVADFTGRAAELEKLTRMTEEVGAGAPGTVVISAIGGTAGVGKTALALHFAHQVVDKFADGQLYVNLRGFDRTGVPVTSEEAIRGFLDSLGVPPERIPHAPDAQADLYRSMLADKRMLVMLDNAHGEAQVRPLLPAAPASLVIVTSRAQLAGLSAADGARLLSLDVLAHGEAVQLLTARLGADRCAAEPDAVADIAALCACLPLALAVAAARAATRPGFPLAALAAELRDTAGRLDALDTIDSATSVRTVFSWSHRQLGTEPARMFRLLGVHPGPDVSVPAAASLGGIARGDARFLLRDLARVHLITEHVPGRYAFHDLLRAYAADQAHGCDSEPSRIEATARVLDHYLHTACHAARLLDPGREPAALTPHRPNVVPERPADYRQALGWFEAEHTVLLSAVALAEENGFDSHAWQLAYAMTPYLPARGHHQEFTALQQIALAAATRADDIGGQAVSNRLLADALRRNEDFNRALRHYKTSFDLYRRLGNRLGEAQIHQSLGTLAYSQGRTAEQSDHHEQALRLYRSIGHKAGEAEILNNMAWYANEHRNYEQARMLCRQALILCAETGHRRAEGHLWDTLGYAEQHLGNLGEAADCYRRSIGIHHEFGDRWVEAGILTHLGDTCHALGDPDQARQAWQQALALFEQLGHSKVDEVRAKLASINEQMS